MASDIFYFMNTLLAEVHVSYHAIMFSEGETGIIN